MSAWLWRDAGSAAPLEKRLYVGLHLVNRQSRPITMTGQHPFETMVEKFADRIHQYGPPPDQTCRRLKRPRLGIPP